jgi:hypothetical protein
MQEDEERQATSYRKLDTAEPGRGSEAICHLEPFHVSMSGIAGPAPALFQE